MKSAREFQQVPHLPPSLYQLLSSEDFDNDDDDNPFKTLNQGFVTNKTQQFNDKHNASINSTFNYHAYKPLNNQGAMMLPNNANQPCQFGLLPLPHTTYISSVGSHEDQSLKKFPTSDTTESLNDPILSNQDSPNAMTCCNPFQLDMEPIDDFTKPRSIPIQTDAFPFEMNFILRETAVHGCDLIRKIPQVTGMADYATYIREKAIEFRSSNVCYSINPAINRSVITSEYAKIFLKIADCYLEGRNCFGVMPHCNLEQCCLRSERLGSDYTQWMQATSNLLQSITHGLESVVQENSTVTPRTLETQAAMRQNLLTTELSNMSAQELWHEECSSQRDYTKINNIHKEHHRSQYSLQGMTNFPLPHFQNEQGLGQFKWDTTDNHETKGYLKPLSYDVTRKNVNAKKRENITKSKSQCFQDDMTPKGFVLNLPNSGSNKELAVTVVLSRQSKENEYDNVITSFDKWNLYEDKRLKDSQPQNSTFSKMERQTENEKQFSEPEFLCESKTTEMLSANRNNVRNKKTLDPSQAMQIEKITSVLWDNDLPLYFKYSAKNKKNDSYKAVKHPIFLDTIANKHKNGTYETIEQFIHDSRRLFNNCVIYSQDNPNDREKIMQAKDQFELLLSSSFGQSYNWIKGDPKEVNQYSELRYSRNAKRRAKVAKLQRSMDLTSNAEGHCLNETKSNYV